MGLFNQTAGKYEKSIQFFEKARIIIETMCQLEIILVILSNILKNLTKQRKF